MSQNTPSKPIDKEAESMLPRSLRAMAEHEWSGWGGTKHLGQGRVSRAHGDYRVEGSPQAGWNVLSGPNTEHAVGLTLRAARMTAVALEAEVKEANAKEYARLKALADAARANPGANVIRGPKKLQVEFETGENSKRPVIGVDAVSPIAPPAPVTTTHSAPTVAPKPEHKPVKGKHK